jgi:hypothetical protein
MSNGLAEREVPSYLLNSFIELGGNAMREIHRSKKKEARAKTCFGK